MSKNITYATKETLKSDVSEEELKKLKKTCGDLLSQDRQKLLLKHPFVGNILMGLDLIPVRDVRCRTACTDAKHVFIDIAFWSELDPDQRVFVLAHEVWHCALMHFARRMKRDPEMFNIATDCEINVILRNDGLNPPADVCFPPYELEGKNAEEIYEYLLKKAKKNDKVGGRQNCKGGSGCSGSDDQNSQNGNQSGSQSQDEKNKNRGDKDGKVKGQFDKHEYTDLSDMTEEELKDWAEKNQPKDKYGKVGFDDDYNPGVDRDAQDRMRRAVVSAAQAHERSRGDIPGSVRKLLNDILTPEIPWQEVLARFVNRCSGIGRKTWCPPNRRHIHRDLYIQGRSGESINVCVCIDTSGSCTDELPKFMSELKGLVESFDNYKVTVLQCDADVQKCDEYDNDNPLEVDKGVEIKGFGGTSFSPCYDYIRKNGIECDCVVYFTDGFGDVYKKNPLSVPSLFVLTADGDDGFCDWGQKVHFRPTNRSNRY